MFNIYNGTSYVRLAPGTAGQVLQTQGAGANPVWAADAGGLFASYAFIVDQKTAKYCWRNIYSRSVAHKRFKYGNY